MNDKKISLGRIQLYEMKKLITEQAFISIKILVNLTRSMPME